MVEGSGEEDNQKCHKVMQCVLEVNWMSAFASETIVLNICYVGQTMLAYNTEPCHLAND